MMFSSDLSLICIGLFVFSYLLGSIPFGYIFTRYFSKTDIRTIGSGNIGATNVLRTGSKKLAALTLMCDAAKGLAAVLLARFITDHTHWAIASAALGVVWGHCFPIWLRFKGGKGVATGLAVAFGLSPFSGALSCIIWLIAVLLSRMSSAGAIAAFVSLPVLMHIIHLSAYTSPLFWAMIIISLTVIIRHRGNIYRIIHGKEPLITFGQTR